MEEKLQSAITTALETLRLSVVDVHLEHPTDLTHGDYSTNVALVAAKQVEANPRELAAEIVEKLQEQNIGGVEKIMTAGPGFINFYLTSDFFHQNVAQALVQGDRFGSSDRLAGKKVIVEYTDPNPFKVFHLGHLMPNIVGESLARIIEWNGAEVKRANYQGDVGLHVAKAIWGMQKLAAEQPAESANLSKQMQWLGQAYAAGARAYEDDEAAQERIRQINKAVYDRTDAEINALYDWGRTTSLAYFDEMYDRLGTKFDYFFFESQMAELGARLVKEFTEQGVFKVSDGAYIFPGEEYGLHTRVFLNAQGLPTYEAKDLANAEKKYAEFPYDQSIVITASEQDAYFAVVLKAMEFVAPELAQKTTHISHGMLLLPTGKMSSRTGNVVAAETLLNDIQDRALAKMSESTMSAEERQQVAAKISVAAVKYAILKQAIGRDVVFDMEKSLSLEGDSGPYLEYTAVRARSVVAKGREQGLVPAVTTTPAEVSDLERVLPRFPEVVARAYDERAPQYIVTYLIELASLFNSYYASTKIVTNDPESLYRLALTEAVATTLTNGLEILGIKVPAEM
jgi:arginyl-tRNA synthetase